MLEVSDFNAIRISLASPEQIRSWSYGEVTRPETINYRTLKPEKDGLFCERIFGPTKDFECYCGKYKRIRFRGVVCERCGVEVARAKVRRERMGHIELAAPVAHIWFVKSTPSRLGLLLDMSPRNLEQVLYFARYIVTRVDAQAQAQLRERLHDDFAMAMAARDRAFAERSAEIEAQLEAAIAPLEEQRRAEMARFEAALATAVDAAMTEAAALEQTLRAGEGTAAADIVFGGATLVATGAAITRFHVDTLRELAAARVAEIEAGDAHAREGVDAMVEAQADVYRRRATESVARLNDGLNQERETLRRDLDAKIDELDSLRSHKLLTEAQYRDYRSKFGSVFEAAMGAEALRDLLADFSLEGLRAKLMDEIHSTSGQRRKKAAKRLRVVEALRKSGNKPDWMLLTVLPVLPPDLRPMVQLDGGRFATSDLNDLYRRVINRNNRLRRLMELEAPEIIVRNEKRMLQEAVDSLIDNGRRGRAVSSGNNHRLKSLSDLLRGKQGRFRQNLLGKRVDYSGRSVIVVGPNLKLHQCGLPKRMALELFKPFVMRELVADGLAHNIKSAKRIVERVRPEVWDILERVIKERPVLLNRAPTLHRLGIQAFEPILIEGSAIQIHPLVCAAFNADFDGDQMAVHVPLSREAVIEARQLMMSTRNILSPSSGDPTVAPTLDMVLGCYYMTTVRDEAKGSGKALGSFEEALLAYDLGHIDLQAKIRVRDAKVGGQMVETSVGRIIFNEVLPPEFGYRNQVMDRRALRELIAECYRRLGDEATAVVADAVKDVGFRYATKSGMTIAISDLKAPPDKAALLEQGETRVAEIEESYNDGLITEDELYKSKVEVWTGISDTMKEATERSLDPYGSVAMMATSGAKGNISQITQMSAMRGLMTDPSGRIIEEPIRSSFREGLSVLEYFISTHGARKGLADTALRTADSGYLTRRLVDVAQEVIVREDDCGTLSGILIADSAETGMLETLQERIISRLAASPIAHPVTGEIIVDRNEEIDEAKAEAIVAAGIRRVPARSPLSCEARRGICAKCYGRSLGRGRPAQLGEAVGIVAAQSIGEPGTQLTMRTFHTGGVAGLDITSGLPRVEELFEARVPKGQAIVSEIDGLVQVFADGDQRRVRVTSSEFYRDEYPLPPGYRPLVADGDQVEGGQALAVPADEPDEAAALVQAVLSRLGGQVTMEDSQIVIYYEERDEREYPIPAAARLHVEDGSRIHAGDYITEGSASPQDILRIKGKEAVQLYLVEEVQKVYRSQGVNIHDKHIEVIVRQMLRRVRVDSPGDTDLLPGDLVDIFRFEDINAHILAEGGEPAQAEPVLLGATKASLSTDSFLAAASFQETTRVLTEAAISGAIDRLWGLKECVIIGKLIPARNDEFLGLVKPEPPQLPPPAP